MNHIVESCFCKVQKVAILLSKKIVGIFFKTDHLVGSSGDTVMQYLKLNPMCFVLWVLPVDQAVLWIKMEAPNQNDNLNLKLIVLIEMHISLLHP